MARPASYLVLGAGMVGSVIAADLASRGGKRLLVADASRDALDRARERIRRLAPRARFETVECDASAPQEVRRLAGTASMVFGALPSHLGFAALTAILEAGRPCCDISFMPEDFRSLDRLARRKGVTAVPDCGVAPGLSNLLAGWGCTRLARPERLEILVGGLPARRTWPFEYKAGFSPRDVIEEYTRPARLVEHGRIVVREALSEPELVELPGVGTLESFNTDGLRSVADTLKVPFMREKTLRYPGHIELMRVFRATGLFAKEPVEVDGLRIRPIDLLAKLLFPKWTYEEGEEDLTVMRVSVEGTDGGVPTRLVWDLLDRADPVSRCTSMSRTTAFPCAIVGRMIAAGRIRTPGVVPPELLARDASTVKAILAGLATRGVRLEARSERIGTPVAARRRPRTGRA